MDLNANYPSLIPASTWTEFWTPVLLLGSAGLFGWAVRGSSGYGSVPGCVFAGTLYALTWYLLGREKTEIKTRRYGMGWTMALMLFGIGISGMQGWMQWPAMVQGYVILNADVYPNLLAPINPFWGYWWFFLVAVHWGGLGAIGLAWAGSKTPLTVKDWGIRLLFGGIGFLIAWVFFTYSPQLFLPPAEGISTADYFNENLYPTLHRVVISNREAVLFLGVYLGFLAFEVMRKDWLNVKLIVIVGVLSGLFWVIFQFWQFMDDWFPHLQVNWWRCWESSAGFGLGAAYGVGFFVCNKSLPKDHPDQRIQPYSKHRNAERIGGFYGGVIVGVCWSMINGIKGYLNIYYQIDTVLLGWLLPILLTGGGCIGIIIWQTLKSPYHIGDGRDNISEAIPVFLVMYLIHRELGLQVTGPLENPGERAFFMYYLGLSIFDSLLFTILYILRKRKV
jgi:hypothetical protein